jgi:L-amino acid N-acyltransferase YncA
MIVRDATPADAAACVAIYAPYVRDTALSFELTPPTEEWTAERIEAAHRTHAWLVAELDGAVVGYALAGQFRPREAYRYTCEVSAYIEPGRRRAGIGSALYTALLDRLIARGYRTAIAVTTLPNPASVRLHKSFGFTDVGTLRRVGWKHDVWHDVMWLQRALVDDDEPPGDLR